MQTITMPASEAFSTRTPGQQMAWLHDHTLQMLEFVATGGFGTCRDRAKLQLVARNAADELRSIIDPAAASDTMREACFVALLESTIAHLGQLSNTEVLLDCDALLEPIDPVLARELAAATGAAVANVHKHARATRASVHCYANGGRIDICVSDDGRGFDPASTPQGFGIRRSLHERISICGGRVHILSAPGHGTEVWIVVDERATSERGVA